MVPKMSADGLKMSENFNNVKIPKSLIKLSFFSSLAAYRKFQTFSYFMVLFRFCPTRIQWWTTTDFRTRNRTWIQFEEDGENNSQVVTEQAVRWAVYTLVITVHPSRLKYDILLNRLLTFLTFTFPEKYVSS